VFSRSREQKNACDLFPQASHKDNSDDLVKPMSPLLAAPNLAELPDDGGAYPHGPASRRGEPLSIRRPEANLLSYLMAMTIAVGLIVAWAGICWI
jgi:hypothetical protein